jgi:hypothetical protein
MRAIFAVPVAEAVLSKWVSASIVLNWSKFAGRGFLLKNNEWLAYSYFQLTKAESVAFSRMAQGLEDLFPEHWQYRF